MQFDSEKPDKITRGACACNDDKVIFENPLIYSAAVFRVPGMNWDSRVWDGTCPAPGGLSKKLHAKAAAAKQQSITLVNQSFDERKIVVLCSDASDKTAKQNESDDHFRLADDSSRIVRSGKILVATWTTCGFYDGVPLRVAPAAMVNCE